MRALLAIFGALCLVTTTAHADDTVACKEAQPDTKISATFKPEVSIYDLTLWLRGFTCKNVIIAPDVAKHAMKLTVSAPRPLVPKQAMQLFLDAVQSAGLIVDQKPNTIVIKLGPNMPRNCPGTGTTSPPPASGSGSGGGELSKNPFAPDRDDDDDDDDKLQHVLDAGIKKLGDTHYQISKSLVDTVLANPMPFTKVVRVVPSIKDGKPAGIKLYAIRPTSGYAKLGLTNGDTIVSVNGVALTDAEKGLEIFQKLRSTSRLEVNVIRRGKPLTLTYVIK